MRVTTEEASRVTLQLECDFLWTRARNVARSLVESKRKEARGEEPKGVGKGAKGVVEGVVYSLAPKWEFSAPQSAPPPGYFCGSDGLHGAVQVHIHPRSITIRPTYKSM